MMKKTLIFALTLVICVIMLMPCRAFAEEAQTPQPPEGAVNAKAAVLMSLDTGDVLYKLNESEHLSPASVTKIMTILLVLEALDNKTITLQDSVTASEEAVSMGGSQIWLEVGETMTVEELFKAVVVASANDACTALAEYVGGSTAGFVKMMNDKAEALGLKDTHFENCNGLDDTVTNHYSCAYDLAVIAREVMKHPLIEDYTGIWLDSLRGGKTELNNTNKLMNTYNGITGLKTGTTSNAGFCVAATARRDGMSLVAVVLGSDTSEERFDTAANLLDFGFAYYELLTPEIDGTQLTPIPVKGGDKTAVSPVAQSTDGVLVLKGGGDVTYDYRLPDELTAPVKKGSKVGEIVISGENGAIGSVPLVAAEDVLKLNLKDIIIDILLNI